MNRPSRAAATAIIVTMLVFAIGSLIFDLSGGCILVGAVVVGAILGFFLAGYRSGKRERAETDYSGAL
jgi:accessory gene regulator protein AgrB